MTKCQVIEQPGWIDFQPSAISRQESLNFGSECQLLRGHPVIQRLDADRVAKEPKLGVRLGPNSKSEHPIQLLNTRNPITREQICHNLRIRLRAESNSIQFQFSPQCGEVVHLAVVDSDILSRAIFHRLIPGIRKVDYAEAYIAQTNGPIDKSGAVVRPSMTYRFSHRYDPVALHHRSGKVKNANNAAH